MTDKKLVLTTAGSNDEARKIAEALVTNQLAACVSVVSKVNSIYRWEGKVQEADEWLLLIKTTAAATDEVRKTIREMHSYELPECMVIHIESGCNQYLNWLGESVEVKNKEAQTT